MDVIGATLFAAAVTLLIAVGLVDMFKLALPGPLARLHEHGVFGVLVATLLIMATIFLWAVGLMSPPDTNGNNG